MGLTYDFTNVRGYLGNLSKQLNKELIDGSLDAAKKPILETMKSEVPKDSWELHDNLGEIKKQGSGFSRKIILGIDSEDREIIERGYYQEHGHSRMLGKKWMKRSFQISKSEANSQIVKYLRERLMKK